MKATAIKHVGIATKDAEWTAKWFMENLGAEYVERKPSPAYGMNSTYIQMGEERLELMEPVVENEGLIGEYILKNKGKDGIHHISLAVDDIDALEKDLESKGIPLIGKGIVDTHKGFFIHPKACGILIEVFQYDYVK